MNPPDVRTCTLRELHYFLQRWSQAQDSAQGDDEWVN